MGEHRQRRRVVVVLQALRPADVADAVRRPFSSISGVPGIRLDGHAGEPMVPEEVVTAAIAADKEYHERAVARVVAKCARHKKDREEELKHLRAEVKRLSNKIKETP